MVKPQPGLHEKVMSWIIADVISDERGIGDLEALWALIKNLEELNNPAVTAQLEAFLPKKNRDFSNKGAV